MRTRLLSYTAFGLMAAGTVMAVLSSAQANPYFPGLTNLDFTQYTGSAPKNYFTNVNPVGWTGGSGLIFIASTTPGHQATDGYLDTYGNPSPNLPGNYVMADGNPDYEGSFNYQVHNLIVGQSYDLIFYQGASQQTGFANALPTSMQWVVSLNEISDGGLQLCNNCGPVDPIYGQTSTYFSSDANADIVASPLMITPPGGVTDWQQVNMTFIAKDTDALLSFLAWGDNGSTVNIPPIAFLTGVNTPNLLNVPEPTTLSLFGAGIAGAWMRRRARKKASV